MQVLPLLLLFLLPWAATWLGSVAGIRMRLASPARQAAFLGFAGGVMVSASIWSLILPAFDSLPGLPGTAIATAGFVLGCGLMLVLDKLLPHQHAHEDTPEGHASHLTRPMLLVMAVMLHNIPEGVALGVVMAATLREGIGFAGAAAFALGLALQNFPEGMAVVVPLRESGMTRRRLMRWGTLASCAEPAAALLGFALSLALAGLGGAVLSLLLSLAAGAMMFIVVEELIPASQADATGHAPTYGFLIGFWMMAVLGVVLG